jgi:flagellar hook assembly protein FlgD
MTRASGTTIRYDLLAGSPVKLTVFDAQGRAVRHLLDERLQLAGSYSLAWDGRDDAGRVAPGGVYFYRLDAGASSQSKRAVKLD